MIDLKGFEVGKRVFSCLDRTSVIDGYIGTICFLKMYPPNHYPAGFLAEVHIVRDDGRFGAGINSSWKCFITLSTKPEHMRLLSSDWDLAENN